MQSSERETIPKSVWILAASQALAMSGIPMMILVSGLLGVELAPSQKLATLPIASTILGTAVSTIPVAMLMKRIGRKKGLYAGYGFGLISSAVGFAAATSDSFAFLILSALFLGVSLAFAQQARFAAMECASSPKMYGPVLSVIMCSGLVAAIVGPEIGAAGKDLLISPHGFAGSFALLALVQLAACGIFYFFREPQKVLSNETSPGRPLGQILVTKNFLLAALVAAVGYIVMSFVMTATPINMYELCGYGINATKRVIQGHILAMFLPSLIGGWLMKKFGAARLLVAGTLAYVLVVTIGIAGQQITHFWAALLLLGFGWNFLFVTGTALLPESYEPNERFKVQAANDFVVFGSQATAALSSGWFLFRFGWNSLLLACIPAILVGFAVAIVRWKKEISNKASIKAAAIST